MKAVVRSSMHFRNGAYRPRPVEVTLDAKGKLVKARTMPWQYGPFFFDGETITRDLTPKKKESLEKLAKEAIKVQHEAAKLGITERALKMRKKKAQTEKAPRKAGVTLTRYKTKKALLGSSTARQRS